ncbi:MAG: carboxypeptidase-like regulatory domain-containing protein, partial [Anaerolineae bacterium]
MIPGGHRRSTHVAADVTRPAVLASQRRRARRRRRGLRSFAVIVLVAVGGLSGQWADRETRVARVTLSGSVVDLATEAPVAWASVRVGAFRTAADGAGGYRVELPPGRYRVRSLAPGYTGTTMEGVLVGTQATVVNVGLAPESPDAVGARRIAARLTAPPGTDPLVDGAQGPTPIAAAAATRDQGDGVVTMARPVTAVPRDIRVLLPSGDIVAMETDEYLKGVVPSEMGYVFR